MLAQRGSNFHQLEALLDLFDEKLESGSWTALDTRTYGGINNALRLTLAQLQGMKVKKVKTPSLDEALSAHRRTAAE